MGWLTAAALAALCGCFAFVPAAAAAKRAEVDFRGQQVSADAGRVARWAVASHDHRSLPFAVVDKKNAQMYVFDRAGRLRGATAVLLGQAGGDRTTPGVGYRAQIGRVGLNERTTPAGRFVSEPGRNRAGEHVVWVDYDSAFAIHRLRPDASQRQRQARLASATPRDNRASFGCVVVPVRFYLDVVSRVIGHGRAIVYVLPEQRIAKVSGAL
jgi:hypothetical protein